MRIEVTVHGDRRRQEIHSFGASDAWSTEAVGHWPAAVKEEICTLLFDTGIDEDGRPNGIGLSCWRVLAGAGTTARTANDWRASETYLRDEWRKRGIEDDTSYDFSRCPGQRWFVLAAHRHNVPHFVLFAHSPPAPMTANAESVPDSGTCNLATRDGFRAREFAVYLTKIMSHFERLGIHFAAVSPVHEAHWQSDATYCEGCSFTNEEIGRVMRSLESEMVRRSQRTMVGVPDAGTIDYLTQPIPAYERSSDFIRAYFGDGRIVPSQQLLLITGHSYFSCWPQEDRLVATREALAEAMAPSIRHGAQYWMTEYSLYIPAEEAFVPEQVARALSPGGREEGLKDRAGMDAALWVARVIHCDLVIAGASAWHWWLAMSPEGVTEGLLRLGDKTFTTTKTLYALGHYSLFVRPGMVRVETNRSDDQVDRESLEGLLMSAFTGHGRVVLVAVNMGHVDEEVKLGLVECGDVLPGATWFRSFVTSGTASLTPYRSFRLGGSVKIPKRSVVTCVAEICEDGDQFYLVAAGSEHGLPLCLEVSHGSPQRCAMVGVGRLVGHGHQLWQLNAIGSGMSLAACHSGYVLDVVNESKTPKSPLHQNARQPSPSQVWMVERLPNGTAYLTVQHSKHVLEAYGNSVRVNTRLGRPEQLWMLVPHDADLANIPLNPALSAAHLQKKTMAAWCGEWVDELPPPMAKVPAIHKPSSRYAPQNVAPTNSDSDVPQNVQKKKKPNKRGSMGGSSASTVSGGQKRKAVRSPPASSHSRASILCESDESGSSSCDNLVFHLKLQGGSRQDEQYLAILHRMIVNALSEPDMGAPSVPANKVTLRVISANSGILLVEVCIVGIDELTESQTARLSRAVNNMMDVDKNPEIGTNATSSESH